MKLHDPCRAAAPGLTMLSLPGWQGSGPTHWQSRWERLYGDRRVEQHDWNWPLRGDWMMQLEAAVTDSPAAGLVLVAHSAGCHLVAAWAAHSRHAARVHAAFLVAPPDADRPDFPPQVHSFRPAVRKALPFPALAVLSADDPYAGLPESRALARDWGAAVHEAGARGHLNAASGLGDWPEGRRMLADFLAGAAPPAA